MVRSFPWFYIFANTLAVLSSLIQSIKNYSRYLIEKHNHTKKARTSLISSHDESRNTLINNPLFSQRGVARWIYDIFGNLTSWYTNPKGRGSSGVPMDLAFSLWIYNNVRVISTHISIQLSADWLYKWLTFNFF